MVNFDKCRYIYIIQLSYGFESLDYEPMNPSSPSWFNSCFKELTPRKKLTPLNINGWKMTFPFENGSCFGDIRHFFLGSINLKTIWRCPLVRWWTTLSKSARPWFKNHGDKQDETYWASQNTDFPVSILGFNPLGKFQFNFGIFEDFFFNLSFFWHPFPSFWKLFEPRGKLKTHHQNGPPPFTQVGGLTEEEIAKLLQAYWAGGKLET